MRQEGNAPKFLKRFKPKLIAIVGGSGSGKTWLADNLGRRFGGKAMRLSLDHFYRDRSHLSAKQRSKINFDHPRAIDWDSLQNVLEKICRGDAVRAPRYDFATHCRAKSGQLLRPKPLIIMDGLWLLHRRSLRSLVSLGIYVDSPQKTCLQRRLKRDLAERGRDAADIRRQFLDHVVPMHQRFVAPQIRRAHLIVDGSAPGQVEPLVERLKNLLKENAL